MSWQPLRWKYWMDLLRRRQLECDLDEELKTHVAIEIQQRIDRGESYQKAHTEALREMRMALVKEVTRDTWSWRWMERLMQDLHYACRSLYKSWGLTAMVVL